MTPEQLAVRLDYVCSFINICVDALHGREDPQSKLVLQALAIAKSEVAHIKDEVVLMDAGHKTKPASVKVPKQRKPRKPKAGKS